MSVTMAKQYGENIRKAALRIAKELVDEQRKCASDNRRRALADPKYPQS